MKIQKRFWTLARMTILLIVFFVFITPVIATYDPLSVSNNHFGIHILDTSEVEKAAEFVNSSGGDWGYVTIPIRANDRNLEKWMRFMDECHRLHLIPILRIASFPSDPGTAGDAAHWMAPNEFDLVDFANFLDELPWPIKNRYIIIYNEPNHQGEWGGFVNPSEYARVLDRATDIFHKKNGDFFVISAGMDASAPNGTFSMNSLEYLAQMHASWPESLSKVDGFSFHAYGNPAFSTPPNVYTRVNVASYRFELEFMKSLGIMVNKPIFLTEAGWKTDGIGGESAAWYYQQAFSAIWLEPNIVAITPFLLDAQAGPFAPFSFIDKDGSWKKTAQIMMKINKVPGGPQLSPKIVFRTLDKIQNGGQNQQSRSDLLTVYNRIKFLVLSWLL